MRVLERLGLSLLQTFDPEHAHGLALKLARSPVVKKEGPVRSEFLKTDLAGIPLANPLGLAAGFDKNATAVDALSQVGFGFIEVGAATPKAQPGNPKPRLFRLRQDSGVINRFGFNNDGAKTIAARLSTAQPSVPVGLNLGANKDSDDRTEDFASVLRTCGPFIDFATVNVSSPNTERLRDLQGKDALSAVLEATRKANAELMHPVPIFLKISPDLTENDLADIAEAATASGISAIIATNTTLSREGLFSPEKDEAGGLSGQPLFERSTRVLAQLATLTTLPLVGVGGIASPYQAYVKIRAGATALQLYSGLVYGGLSLITEILNGVEDLAKADGFERLSDAVGTGKGEWT